MIEQLTDFEIYFGNDPKETLDLLASEESPLAQKFDSGSPYFFEPRDWNQALEEQPPSLSYDPPNGETLYLAGKDSLENMAFKEMNFTPTALFEFNCNDDPMSDREEKCLREILRYFVQKNRQFFVLGSHYLGGDSVFVGGYDPSTNTFYSQNECSPLAKLREFVK